MLTSDRQFAIIRLKAATPSLNRVGQRRFFEYYDNNLVKLGAI
jgi:hypothetical protein